MLQGHYYLCNTMLSFAKKKCKRKSDVRCLFIKEANGLCDKTALSLTQVGRADL